MLENTRYRLENGLGLTAVYFGGSITEGAGASAYENCWAAKTTAWLGNRYPACKVHHVNAAIGGTDSQLAVYRCERDVLSYDPDIVFYEFSVNDEGGDFMTLLNNNEAVIRKLRAHNPYVDIVFVYTITWSETNDTANGKPLSAKAAHSAAAYYYNCPQINIGGALYDAIARNLHLGETPAWHLYTTDAVHPNDEGYQIYANTIEQHLTQLLDSAAVIEAPTAIPMPAPFFDDAHTHVRAGMVDCTAACTDESWTLCEESLAGRYPHYIECTKPGGTLTLSFEGTRIDAYFMMAPDSGDMTVSVDGGEERTVSSWDIYCTYRRANLGQFISGLPAGKHTLTLRVADTKNEKSTGYAVRIGAFCVL